MWGRLVTCVTAWIEEPDCKVLVMLSSPPVEHFETQMFSTNPQVPWLGILNENQILVIDFEGFDYNSLIVKDLSVHSKNYQETLLFKPSQAFSTISTIIRDSIIILTKRIHGIDWDSGVYPYISILDYLASLRVRFLNAIVFVDGHVKRAFISNFF